MYKLDTKRRQFLRNSAVSIAVPVLPLDLLAQTTLRQRVEWQAFKITPQYDSLLNAIRRMKANTNAADPMSWEYWKNIHVTRCPHGIAYFLAWHRGYLYYFERQLRAASGDSNLVLPYWDYYSYATLPAEFTDASSTNPLYVQRVNVNVRQALSLAPFSPLVTNFQTGTTKSFETSVEGAPHNQLHNLIGNVMATMNSPVDPIFWLHHANIDRLWVAWVAAGAGRKMPLQKNSYWSGSFTYSSTLGMQRRVTYDTRSTLQYFYQNETMPTSIPLAQSSAPKLARVQAGPNDLLRSVPPIGSFKVTGPRATSASTFSLGGAQNIGLDRRSISSQLPVNAEHWAALQEVARGKPATLPGGKTTYRSAKLVLDGVELAEAGEKGGYFYRVYLNVPAMDAGVNRPTSLLIGTLGPFEIRAASHHGHGPARLRFSLRDVLPANSPLRVGMISVSFVRVDGDNSPEGTVIGIEEARIELSGENG